MKIKNIFQGIFLSVLLMTSAWGGEDYLQKLNRLKLNELHRLNPNFTQRDNVKMALHMQYGFADTHSAATAYFTMQNAYKTASLSDPEFYDISSLRKHFTELFHDGDYDQAFRLSRSFGQNPDYYNVANGFALLGTLEGIQTLLNNHIETKSQDYFGKLLTTKQFDEANRLARAYAIKNEAQSVLWLQSVAAAQQQVDHEAARVAARLAVADVADQEKADFNAERTLWQAEKAQKDAALDIANAQNTLFERLVGATLRQRVEMPAAMREEW